MRIRLPFKGNPTVRFMVAVSFAPSVKIVPAIEDPVNNEKQLDLLVKVDLFVIDNFIPVTRGPAYPDKHKPGKTSVRSKDPEGYGENKREHL